MQNTSITLSATQPSAADTTGN